MHYLNDRTCATSLWLVLALALLVAPVPWTAHAQDPVATPTPDSLMNDLRSDDPVKRVAAIAAASAFGDPQAVTALFDLLANPDQRVGLYAAQALGALASPENLPALREGMRHPNPDVRWRTALALGELGDQRAVPVLARAMDDPEVLVHRTAADSLVKLGGPAASSALVRALDSSQPSVVNAAMNGLTAMGKTAVTPLAIGLSVGNAKRRANSATMLGYIGDPRALPALQTSAEIDADPAVRAEAEWAIEQINKKN
jgi:HEAT repeat protein